MQVAAVPAATCIGCGPQAVRAANAAKPSPRACDECPGVPLCAQAQSGFGVRSEHFLGLGAHCATVVA
jgi:hypothetical protein